MDNIIPFPFKTKPERLHPDAVAILMLEAAFAEADKYGYNLKANPDVMLDFEAILKLVNASVSRDADIDNAFQKVLDKLTGADQELN